MNGFHRSLPLLALASMIGSPLMAQSAAPKAAPSVEVEGSGASLRGEEPKGPPRPAPRDAAGHPDLTGYWKPIREKGKPGGNIGKDLPGFKLPLTAAGEAALKHNLTE